MSRPDIDPAVCPLCAQANDCGMARGSETCWCFDVVLSSEALERIPEPAKGRACVCKSCGTGTPGADRES